MFMFASFPAGTDRRRRFPMIARLAGLGIVTAFLASSILPAAAADKPPKPVSVVGPVQVEGAVETVNDALRLPYFQSRSGDGQDTLSFTIPAGKRLVIEAISVLADVPNGQSAYFALNASTPFTFMFLAPQIAMPWTAVQTLVVCTHAIRMRLDAPADQDGTVTISVFRSGTGGTVFRGAISGYLVDL